MDADLLQEEHQIIAAINANTSNSESIDQHRHHQVDGLDQLKLLINASPANFHVPLNTPAPDLFNLLYCPGALNVGDHDHHFHTMAEKQRRKEFQRKFETLKAMVPNSTRADRASIIQDSIDYIKELQWSVEELKFLAEMKRRSKRLKNSYGEDEKAPSNGEIEDKKDNPEPDGEESYNNDTSEEIANITLLTLEDN